MDFEQALKEHGLALDNSQDDTNKDFRWLTWDKDKEEWSVWELCDYADAMLYSGTDKQKALMILIEGMK